MNSQENKTLKIILAVLIGMLIVIVGVVAFIFVRGQMKENNYKTSIEEAQKYMATHDYEQAIIQYENAIKLAPEEEEAYLLLADVYVEQDNLSQASYVLKKGYDVIGSIKIKRKLSDIEKMLLAAKAGEKVVIATASQNLSWDTSFVQKIVNYTFDDYKREFGQVTSTSVNEDGYLEVQHSKIDAVFYYKNTEDNKKVVDMGKKYPENTGMPEKISLKSLETLFRNFEGGASLNRMQMLFGERVTPKTLEGKLYIESKEEDLIARFETDSEGNIVSPNSWNELILPLANKKKANSANLTGVVVDAVSGKGVANAKVIFEPDSFSHSTVTEVTDSKGTFSAMLEPDTYKITIKGDGYIEESFDFTVEEGESYNGEQFVISPQLSGEARIVLEWKSQPRDLDSHLTGAVDGGSNIHVFYGNKAQSSGGGLAAELDLDDTDGYGPETTTIHNLNGVYTFSVVDFHSTGTMVSNGATVKIYLPGQSPVTVELSSGSGVTNTWDVCKIDHGHLEVLNRAGSESNY